MASLAVHWLADCMVPGPVSLHWHLALPQTRHQIANDATLADSPLGSER